MGAWDGEGVNTRTFTRKTREIAAKCLIEWGKKEGINGTNKAAATVSAKAGGKKKPPEGGTHNTTQHNTTQHPYSLKSIFNTLFSLSLSSLQFSHTILLSYPFL